jgi:uncharacterized membrane protein
MKTITILLILSFLSVIIYILTKKIQNKLIPAILIFCLAFVFGHLIPFSESNIEKIYAIIKNIIPAVVFLFILDFNFRFFNNNKIGCACKIGAKKYWIIVITAIFVSTLSQVLNDLVLKSENILYLIFLSVFFGLAARLTKLKEINGSQEVATTLFYLLASCVGIFISSIRI